jgi:hypothetical protein
MLHKDTNSSKVARLEALHAEYVAYVRTCVQVMLDQRVYNLPKSAKQVFFPPATSLTSQIEKNARDHAIDIVSAWAKGVYARNIKPTITNLRREGVVTGVLTILPVSVLTSPLRRDSRRSSFGLLSFKP